MWKKAEQIEAERFGKHTDGDIICQPIQDCKTAGDGFGWKRVMKIIRQSAGIGIHGRQFSVRVSDEQGDGSGDQERGVGQAAGLDDNLAEEGENAGSDDGSDADCDNADNSEIKCANSHESSPDTDLIFIR